MILIGVYTEIIMHILYLAITEDLRKHFKEADADAVKESMEVSTRGSFSIINRGPAITEMVTEC